MRGQENLEKRLGSLRLSGVLVEKMENHPAWVKRLRMASIWTRSGHETYIERKKRIYSNEESYLSRIDRKH